MFGLIGVCLSGCWGTARQGQEMRTASDARDQRIAQLEQQARQNQEQLASKIQQLEELLQRATKILHRASAEVGAQIETLTEKQQAVDGQIAEVKHALSMLTR